MPKKGMKWIRTAAWLLFLALLSASLDRITDPPALKPHGAQARAFSLDHPLEATPSHNHECSGWVHNLPAEPRWLSFRLTFENHTVGHLPEVVRQASDPSPPRNS
jgi:hypothetical protein